MSRSTGGSKAVGGRGGGREGRRDHEGNGASCEFGPGRAQLDDGSFFFPRKEQKKERKKAEEEDE